MEELSYHDSLRCKFILLLLHGRFLTFILVHLAFYYVPLFRRFAIWFANLIEARNSPLANGYVLSTCKRPDPGESSLLYKLQKSKDNFSQRAVAAECMDHMAAGIDTTGEIIFTLL